MDAVVLIVRRQHLSTCDRMLPSGLRHLADELVCRSAAETLVEFGMLAVGDMSYEEGTVSERDRRHGRPVKVGSIVHWQGGRQV
jgi:hypothetical protein